MSHAMETVASFLKLVLRPASVTFVVAVLGLGVVLAWSRRTWRIAPFYWLLLLVGYTALSLPVISDWLVDETSGGYTRLQRAADARGAHTIVVLGAGSRTFSDGAQVVDVPAPETVMRTMEGARLYRLLGTPTVILSGGVTDRSTPDARPESETMRTTILRLGVPADHLVLESVSTTTRTEAEAIVGILGNRRTEPILLVTSPMHMRRSVAVFEAAGMKPIPAASLAWPARPPLQCRWCPNHDALQVSDDVVYEQVAFAYYWAQGWTKASQESRVNSQ
jgi:uncharacterized SAM-binding protein YcdF (DUF218 family)